MREVSPSTGEDMFHGDVIRALEGLPEGLDLLGASSWLRARLPAHLARAASELCELRRRAIGRFSRPERGFYTSVGLEQATAPAVAAARARHIAARRPGALVYDATAGMGADSAALAEAGLGVVAGDVDPVALRCARANLHAAGLRHWALVADARSAAVRADYVLLDPDRRAPGHRTLEPVLWSPSLVESLALAARYAGACLKLAPAFDPGRHGASEALASPHRWQWTSNEGELAEVTLWTGELAGDARDDEREALVLRRRGGVEIRFAAEPRRVAPLAPEAAVRVGWMAEPDPAIIRSGLVGALADRIEMAPLGPGIAYLGGDSAPGPGPFRAWRVLETSPADPRRVRRMLARHDVGRVAVKKRGHPETSEVLARRLKGPGQRRGLVAITRLTRGHLVLLLEEPAGR